jgi:hypothetical protein
MYLLGSPEKEKLREKLPDVFNRAPQQEKLREKSPNVFTRGPEKEKFSENFPQNVFNNLIGALGRKSCGKSYRTNYHPPPPKKRKKLREKCIY